jgi:predicted permease
VTRAPRRFLQLPWRSAARIQADVDEELRFELDMRVGELVAQGVPEAEARRRAVADFGDLERTRRYCAALDRDGQREERRTAWLAELRQDARLAWRSVRRTPGFTLVVLLTLALGIGANTAVFSVVRRVLLDRLPYHEPQRLVALYGTTRGEPDARGRLALTDVVELAARPTLAGAAPFGIHAGYTHVGADAAESWQGTSVGPTFFALLGTPPLLGRTIGERDAEAGAEPVVVLSHGLWQRAFGGDPAVVGRTVRLTDEPHTVIGVMPPDFVSPTFESELWVPLAVARMLQYPSAPSARAYGAVARLAPGATLAQLRADLAALAAASAERRPAGDDAGPANPVPLRDAMVGQVRPALLVVMGAASLVLVLACVNVAGLHLSRATARQRELAVRAALGAGRGRLVRQLLTESLLLGLAGGALGVAVAYWGRDLLLLAAGARLLPTGGDVPIDALVLAFALLASLACGVVAGLVPALAGTRFDLQRSLKPSGRGAAGSRGIARTGRVLVAAQVALAVGLLIGAGLLGRTLVALERTGSGYSTDASLLTLRVNLGRDWWNRPRQELASFWTSLGERIAAQRGVRSVGYIGVSPWNGGISVPFVVEGRPPSPGGGAEYAYALVSEGYLETLGIPVRRGRAFAAADRDGAPHVALVSESLARRLWPGRSPIGARVRQDWSGTSDQDAPPWSTVVGVVGDVRESALAEPVPTVYLPARQWRAPGVELVVRTDGDAMALVAPIRRELRALDPSLPLIHPRTMRTVAREGLVTQRLPMLFTTAFALLALLLAALGVYGVTSYAVTSRTREFGIRSALGARRASVLGLVLRQGLATALAGVAAGLLLAAAAARVLTSLLVGVTPHDPWTFVAAPLGLLVVCALASLLPARRATRVPPQEALRAD